MLGSRRRVHVQMPLPVSCIKWWQIAKGSKVEPNAIQYACLLLSRGGLKLYIEYMYM